MSNANINWKSQLLLCKEAFEATTKLDDLTIININGELKTWYEHFGDKIPNSSRQLQKFGEAGMVKICKDKKIGDHRAPQLFAWPQ